MKKELTAERLREALHYDPETGVFTWRKCAKKSIAPGSVAGAAESKGYWQIKLYQKVYAAHRLAWLYVYGDWPKHAIDHINGDPRDNRIENLRDVPEKVNSENKRKAFCTSKTGLLGVSPDVKWKGKWRARINVRGKPLLIGYFDDPEEAHQAYLAAKRKLHEGCTI